MFVRYGMAMAVLIAAHGIGVAAAAGEDPAVAKARANLKKLERACDRDGGVR